MDDIFGWCARHWADIRGNVKFWAVFTVLSAMTTAFHFLVSGMPWWRHVLVDFLFGILVIWLAITIWECRRKKHATVPYPSKSQLFTPLQTEAFQLAKDLNNFLTEEMHSYPRDVDTSKIPIGVFYEISDQRIRWRQRTEAKYEKRFAKRVEDLILDFKEIDISFPLSFTPPPGNVKKIEEDIPRTAGAVIAMAHRIDGFVFFGREQ